MVHHQDKFTKQNLFVYCNWLICQFPHALGWKLDLKGSPKQAKRSGTTATLFASSIYPSLSCTIATGIYHATMPMVGGPLQQNGSHLKCSVFSPPAAVGRTEEVGQVGANWVSRITLSLQKSFWEQLTSYIYLKLQTFISNILSLIQNHCTW